MEVLNNFVCCHRWVSYLDCVSEQQLVQAALMVHRALNLAATGHTQCGEYTKQLQLRRLRSTWE